MKPIISFFSLIAALMISLHKPAMADASLAGIRLIVFLGDSVTQAADYTTDVECWLISQGHRLETSNIGLSSETVVELTAEENAGHVKGAGFARPFIGERLERSLTLTKPDLLFVCYGMNDGSALPEGPDGLRRFGESITQLRDRALYSGVKRIVFCTPPIHDPLIKIDPAKNPHECNLVSYRNWLLSKRAHGWEVVDIHGPMRRDLDTARQTDPTFRFQPDGVHPDRAGHWLMAREILTQYFGAKLDGISSSPQFFKTNGDEIRDLVHQRQKVLFDASMMQIGHGRPHVPGGPCAPPGPSLESAQAQARQISKSIESLVQSSLR
jgi:lysophospholipase L1-like esterase